MIGPSNNVLLKEVPRCGCECGVHRLGTETVVPGTHQGRLTVRSDLTQCL